MVHQGYRAVANAQKIQKQDSMLAANVMAIIQLALVVTVFLAVEK